MVRQAWEYLKHHKQSVNWNNTDMASHIGYEEQGSADEPWEDGKIVIGANREDEEDPIWRYGWPNTTSTHFWDADQGDFWKLHNVFGDFENAYMKAKIYAYGGHSIYIKHYEAGEPGFQGKYYNFDLIDLYKTGHCTYVGYVDGYNHYEEITPQNITLPIETARRYAYLILGRMAHLLMDQTVPAHTHGDIHAWPDTDSYEDWMGVDNNAGNWGYQLTPIMGPRNLGPSGIIDITCSQNPIRDIFYLTNQVGDRFDSDDEFGDANFTDFGKEGIYLVPIYDQLANYTPPPFPIYHEHHKKIGDFAYCFAIKAVASLMYWFAYNTNQFPQNPPPQMPVISTNLINNFLYRGQTVNLNVSNLGNTSYPCYEWRLYTCQGDEQHFTQWPVNEAGLQTLSGRFDINFRMRNNIYNSEPCPYVTDDRFDLNYWVDVRIKNGSGVSAWSNKYHIVPKTTYGPIGGGGGCPYIFTFSPDIDNTNFYKPDNNILHRSEFAEFVDQDIKDLYLIRNSMSIVNNKISIIIQESEPDHDYFDQVRLLAVDHPIGTIVGITESNDIVLYDDINITSTDNAILNGTINITPNIQYNHPTKKIVRGYSDDSIYASYSETAQKTALKRFKDKYLNRVNADSLALIGEIGFNQDRILYPVVNKDYVGTAVIISNTDTYTRSFARRENNSAVIIPFSTTTDAVEHVDINWNSDFEVSYFSVVPIAYSGYVVNELPLTAATHTILGDVLDKITDKDANYAEIDTLSTLTLSFDNIIDPESGMKRDYIFETNGRYLTSTSMNLQKQVVGRLNENKEPARFELFLNYPNPFNPKTLIKYNVGVASKVNISVYNLLGQLVQTLVNENRSPGTYAVEFDGTNLASGMYIYKMETETFTDIKKMVLMK